VSEETAMEVAVAPAPEAQHVAVASPREKVGEWATKNARLLLVLLILAILPYLFTCWGIALIVSRGGCGG